MAHTAEIDSKEAWSGGKSPFGVSYGKMMMWFFLISDALTFGGLLMSYGFIRHKYADVWPKAENVFTHFPFVEQHLPLAYVGLMTFILIMSSVTMVLAVEAGKRMDRRGVTIWMLWTIVGGLAFVLSQAWEWYHFIVGTEEGWVRNVWDYSKGTYVQETVHGANMIVNEYGIFGSRDQLYHFPERPERNLRAARTL
jgi:cytochrome c oxidase subunit III